MTDTAGRISNALKHPRRPCESLANLQITGNHTKTIADSGAFGLSCTRAARRILYVMQFLQFSLASFYDPVRRARAATSHTAVVMSKPAGTQLTATAIARALHTGSRGLRLWALV